MLNNVDPELYQKVTALLYTKRYWPYTVIRNIDLITTKSAYQIENVLDHLQISEIIFFYRICIFKSVVFSIKDKKYKS